MIDSFLGWKVPCSSLISRVLRARAEFSFHWSIYRNLCLLSQILKISIIYDLDPHENDWKYQMKNPWKIDAMKWKLCAAFSAYYMLNPCDEGDVWLISSDSAVTWFNALAHSIVSVLPSVVFTQLELISICYSFLEADWKWWQVQMILC